MLHTQNTINGIFSLHLGWLAEVRSSSRNVKILPRLLFEGWSMMDYKNLFADERKKRELAEYIVHVLKVNIQAYNMNSSIIRFMCPWELSQPMANARVQSAW